MKVKEDHATKIMASGPITSGQIEGETLGWRKHNLASRLPGEISRTSDMHMTTTLMAESEEELKNLLMKVKEENEKVGFSSTFRKLRLWHLVLSLHGK